MRSFILSVPFALAQLAAFSFAIPVISGDLSPLTARAQQMCDNSINTVAGTMLGSPGQISSSTVADATNGIGVTWCAGGSETYVLFGMSSQTTNTSDPLYIALSQLLLYTYGNITAHIKASGDGVMNKGGAVWNPGPVDVTGESAQVVFASQNAPSNKITWGVLGAAVGALINYMGTYGYGMVGYLEVYDGKNEVGTGSIFANNIAPT